jgi:hypothetical protein
MVNIFVLFGFMIMALQFNSAVASTPPDSPFGWPFNKASAAYLGLSQIHFKLKKIKMTCKFPSVEAFGLENNILQWEQMIAPKKRK